MRRTINGSPLSTALIDAVTNDESKEMVEQLINQGVDINATDVFGMSPLAHAAGRGLNEIAKLLISRGADVNGGPHVPRWGNPLIRSIKGGASADISLLLIENGADVNALNYERDEATALILSIDWNSDYRVVEALVNKGADINAVDKYGKSVLAYAVDHERLDVIAMLLEHGVDINAIDRSGNTVLTYAKVREQKEIVDLLVKHGAK